MQTEEPEGRGESSSVDWNKWGGRITTTKEKAGELKEIFRDGQVCVHPFRGSHD